uniref:Uncharacterized protein n=1 Tax=Crouania attenuata TaxID=42002 RepID=A0A4D6WQ37_9FLOR|nr:hypothetical protein [Crouania attenuata]
MLHYSHIIKIKLDLLLIIIKIISPGTLKLNEPINLFVNQPKHNFCNIQSTTKNIFVDNIQQIYCIQKYIHEYSIQIIAYDILKKIDSLNYSYIEQEFKRKYNYYYYHSMSYYNIFSYYQNCKSIDDLFIKNLYLISRMTKYTYLYILIKSLITI